ncbi:MAG: alpha/beta fold hydrolase [Salibacteraceae bacterium]
MHSQKVSFSNFAGQKLSARLELPLDTHPHAFAIFAHCFTCNKNLTAVRNISRSLTREGIAVLRFDFTGLGESEGEFADTNFASNVGDLVAAANFLNNAYQAPTLMIGHSLGGAAVLCAASKIPSLKAIATLGAPYDPEHVTHLFAGGIQEIQEKGQAAVSIGGRDFTIKKEFLDALIEVEEHKVIHEINLPLLILHSPVDRTVDISNATRIYKAAQHPKSFISLNEADHLLTKKSDSSYAGTMIAAWANGYLEKKEEETLSSNRPVVVRNDADEGYSSQVKAGKHRFVSDEPTSVGGNDFGPTPYDLLTASLGACTAMTLRMYANRKKWDLQSVTVHLEHGKQHREDCDRPEQSGSKIDHFDRVIEIEGDLDAKQKSRLLEIADKCPVHRTLHNEVKVTTRLKE